MSDQKSPAIAAASQAATSQATAGQAAPSQAAPSQAMGANQKMITELKVSGHLMALDTGLFCIFNAPGGTLPDPNTGLPGVRISLPPGPAFRPEAVTISSFRDDGWLGGGSNAALVHVARGPAQLLVTIYQAPNAKGEAPRLQILRLGDGGSQTAPVALAKPQPAQAARPGAAPASQPALPAPAQPQAPAPAKAASIPQNTPPGGQASAEAASQAEVIAHVQGRSDVLTKLGEWMGEPGSKRWIEGFAIAPKAVVGPGDIEYQAVLGRGWLSPWAEGAQYCGSRGMSLPILGLRVRLRGEAAERFDCAVTATFVDGTKVGPLDNGEPCQAESLAPLEAFQIRILPRGEMAEETAPVPAATKASAKAKAKAPVVAAPAAPPAKPRAPAKPAFVVKAAVKPVAKPATPAKGRKPAAAAPARGKAAPPPKGSKRGRR